MIIKRKSAWARKVEEKKKYENVWSDWFAWRPTRINEYTIVWFQTIQRRRAYASLFKYNYDYRLKDNNGH